MRLKDKGPKMQGQIIKSFTASTVESDGQNIKHARVEIVKRGIRPMLEIG